MNNDYGRGLRQHMEVRDMNKPQEGYYALPHEVIIPCPYQCKELLVIRFIPYQSKMEEEQGELTWDHPLKLEFFCPHCGETIGMSFVLPKLVSKEEYE